MVDNFAERFLNDTAFCGELILVENIINAKGQKLCFIFKCATKTNEQKAGEYTLTYTYPEIKEMDCIKFIGYSNEEMDGFMKDLEETLNSLKN